MAAELGQQTVEFSALVGRAAEESFLSLKELVEKSRDSDQSDTEKKINILKYIVKTQQRMLRLNVLAKWCQQNPLIQYCQQLGSTLSSHDTCFTQAADSLFFMHEGLQQARAPVYDVPSAIEILLTGSYQRMPKCVEDMGTQSTLTEEEQKPALRKLDTLVRCKILEVSIPKEISEVKISDGTAMLRVNGEFKVLVTLGYRGHLSMWRILHLELLVGERSGLIKMEEMRRHVLGDDLERRMAAAENPFTILYSVLHELCVALVMDTVIRQVQALRQGRWRDAIRFELISDGSSSSSQTNQEGEADQSGLRTPGLKILYWLDLDKNCHIKIEPGSDLQIKCLHSTFVIDPLTGKEAEFSLDQSCIDVERLLLRAICCHRYTRLLEIQKDLAKNSQISRASGDVVLQSCVEETDIDSKGAYKAPVSEYEEGQEVLRVRAYGLSFFTLGVSIRTGRYILQSSQNIIESLALLECEDALNQGSMNAAEVFISLRSKSILHLFASISKFLGLEVYEHGLPAIKLPKSILNGSAMLLMGFPDCGSSYFLLMQLDKDFNPLFNLLEANTEQSGKGNFSDEQNRVVHSKKIDMNQMQMLEGEMNLSLLEWGKSLSFLTIQTSASALPSELSFVGENRIPLSSFASVVDEVFGHSIPNISSHFNPSSASHFGSLTGNIRALKSGTPSPKWEGSLPYGGSLLPSSKLKGSLQSNSHSSSSSVPGRSGKILSSSKSEQDLASLRSPQSVEFGSSISMDDTSKEAIYGKSAQLLSPPRPNSTRISGMKANGPRISPSTHLTGSVKVAGSSPVSQVFDSAVCNSPSYDVVSKQDRKPRKRTLSDMLDLVPTLKGVDTNSGPFKSKKISEAVQAQKASSSQALLPIDTVSKADGYSYGNLIAEANKGNTPSGIYVSALLHVVRHCSVDIKHARLTSQMEALEIPYVEETGFRSASSNIWLRLPFARDDTWKHICLRLGRPGSMSWDVKINDQHFTDLWELQKGNCSTPWGSGVRIANTSDIDSHIRYDPEGVVLSYQSVEGDSIKKLVADVQRLSNARVFALGMRRLLGVRTDEKAEEISDIKAPVDRLSEQMRRAFRIEAVGLTSLWFGFVSGVVARFVVEWESGREGCTMHVFPDQLWPHTKFLEDFINGAEIASLLDCIRLTAGPLNALTAATRPARAGPIPGVPGAAQSIYPQSLPKQATNVTQNPSNTVVNPAATTATSPLANHTLHGAAMLAAASRGGPGIVPSALLPIDVSVVLRGPYWIRIIYRKHFAVDMRCFAGDQVWLQPATPPKGGPSIGGSLPCPQFRPFIMEHVAQELNVLEPNFSGQSPSLPNSQSQQNSVSALSAGNGNRVNVAGPAAISRTANPVAGLNRMGSPLGSTSNLGFLNSGMPIRRPPGAGVPAHVRGELNTAIIGLGDDGGYGGGWVPHVALKKVLRGILKYLGVLWLFAQLPELLKEILGSILKDNEGTLLNLDQEQPALRFFVGGYVFAVSVHRVQLLLQVLSVKRFHHQQQQQQQNSATAQEELTQTEIGEICDYFSRRVASEPYDASRVASFITLLTLPISVLREFLKLIAWKKGLAQAQGGDMAPAQKPRIELCLENHTGLNMDDSSENSSVAKSNIHYDRPHNAVDFALTVVLDSAHIPHINVAGGAAWLPYCVSVRLRYSFGENPNVSFLGMDGSHGGRSCWFRVDDWEKCKQRVSRTVEANGCSPGDNANQGRLRLIADSVQRTLNLCLQGLREGAGVSTSTIPT